MEKKKPENKATSKKTVKKTVAKKVTKAVTKKTTKKATPVAKKVAKKTTVKKAAPKVKASKPSKGTADSSKKKPVAIQSQPQIVPSKPPVQTDYTAPHYEANTEQNVWQDRYEDNRIVLMIRDPFWCFVYWDLSHDKQAECIREIQTGGARLVLRIYDVTAIDFNGANAHRTMDVDIADEATNWYINVWAADRSYCVDLGLLYGDGRFTTIVRSNIVTTPRDSVSPIVDEEWMVVDETFDRLYQTAGAAELGRSSEAITKYMLKRVRADVSSGGLASMGSEGGRPKPPSSEDFWLVVNTELIVYGATQPDATVTIQGQPLRLNQDGTFSVRYALPDGKQSIVVQAVNAVGTQERKNTPVVEKHTE